MITNAHQKDTMIYTCFHRWLCYCQVPVFCDSLQKYDPTAVFGRALLRSVFSVMRRQLLEKFRAEKDKMPPDKRTIVLTHFPRFVWTACFEDGQIHLIENNYYYSFKIFLRFWLVKTSETLNSPQPAAVDEPMKSKVQPAVNYWTDDVKMTSKVQPAADYWTVDGENLVSRKTKSEMAKLLWKRGNYVDWIIKQLLNSAFVGCEEFCRSRRVLFTSAFGFCEPSLICRILYILISLIQ